MGYWKTIGVAQKSKVFTTWSGDTYRLRDFTGGVVWNNPIVYAQVSNITLNTGNFMSFWYGMSRGFRALTVHNGDDYYTSYAQSLEAVGIDGNVFNDLSRRVLSSDWNGVIQLAPNETRHIGYFPNFTGCNLFYFYPPNESGYIHMPNPRDSRTWYTENIIGDLQVLVDGEVVNHHYVGENFRINPPNKTSFSRTYVRGGNVYLRNSMSRYIIGGQTLGHVRVICSPYNADWVTKDQSSLNVFIMESNGVGY